MRTAYSYSRFSRAEQAEGTSLSRQIKHRDIWLAAHPDVRLDTSLELSDPGKTGFDRDDDWETYALAGFLKRIKSGYVKRGSYLLVENLDRLSREKEVKAFSLFLSILQAGITIVQLLPDIHEYDENADLSSLTKAINALARGHEESQLKSDRICEAWAAKRERTRHGEKTRMHAPAWFDRDARGKLSLNPEKAAVIRRIFKMSLEGAGTATIAATLNAEKVPVFGKTEMAVRGQHGKKKSEKAMRPVIWGGSTIFWLLTQRTVIGEYQPGKGRKKSHTFDGPPVPGYYEAVITEKEFDRVQAAMASRKNRGAGRDTSYVNLFSGLLTDPRDGGSFTTKRLSPTKAVLIPVNSVGGRQTQWSSFPAEPFEEAILSLLAEVTVADVRGDDDSASQSIAAISAKIKKTERQIQTWEDKMDDAEGKEAADIITRKINGWRATLKGMNEELAEAQMKAANPIAEAWGECRGLLGLLKKDPSSEMRTKAKNALRRSIADIKCVFAGWNHIRAAFVVVQFRSGRTQGFMISYTGRAASALQFCVMNAVVEITDGVVMARKMTQRLVAAIERSRTSGNTVLGEMLGRKVEPTEKMIVYGDAER